MQFSIGSFEGPLDLLLALVRREEMDIMDIDLHKITEKYLNIIEGSPFLNLDEGGEFIYMASRLIYIKSRMLLPQEAFEESEDEGISSKESLIQALASRSEFLKAAEKLNQRELLNRDVWSCAGLSFAESSKEGKIQTEGVFSLAKIFRQTVKRAKALKMKMVFPSTIEWIKTIKKHFVRGRAFCLSQMIKKTSSKEPFLHQLLLSFLSLLELSKWGAVSLAQKGEDIHVKTLKEPDLEFFQFSKGGGGK